MILKFFDVLKAGKELANPANWKKGLELTNLVGFLVATVIEIIRYKYPTVLIPDGTTEYATETIGSLLVLVNLYLNRATTKKEF